MIEIRLLEYRFKGKVVPGHAVKAGRGSRLVIVLILNLSTTWW